MDSEGENWAVINFEVSELLEHMVGQVEHELEEEERAVRAAAAAEEARRQSLIEEYLSTVDRRKALEKENQALQHKLVRFFDARKFCRRKSSGHEKISESDLEAKYTKLRDELKRLIEARKQRQIESEAECAALRRDLSDIKQEFSEQYERFTARRRALYGRWDKELKNAGMKAKDPEKLIKQETLKEKELGEAVQTFCQLYLELERIEERLKDRDAVGEGFNIVDFDQLRITNQTLNERIEDWSRGILREKNKIQQAAIINSHNKEKLKALREENHELAKEIDLVNASVQEKQAEIVEKRKIRDKTRAECRKLTQKAGLLIYPELMDDFTQQADARDMYQEKISRLKEQHASLSGDILQLRRCLQAARQERTEHLRSCSEGQSAAPHSGSSLPRTESGADRAVTSVSPVREVSHPSGSGSGSGSLPRVTVAPTKLTKVNTSPTDLLTHKYTVRRLPSMMEHQAEVRGSVRSLPSTSVVGTARKRTIVKKTPEY